MDWSELSPIQEIFLKATAPPGSWMALEDYSTENPKGIMYLLGGGKII